MQGKTNVFHVMGWIALVAVAAIAAMLLRTPPTVSVANPTATVQKNEAPDFALQNLEGETVRLSDYRGKAVVLNFWATWCDACVTEMPMLEEIAKKYPDQLVILALNRDEARSDVIAFRDDAGLTFPILLDAGGKVFDLYHGMGLPTSVFIDSDGMIRAVQIGAFPSIGLFDTYLKKIGIEP
ncbi:MAG: TlpA disulfide reductase family protein [Anaerolineaceae bacterium]